jgi:rubredoxin
VKINTGSLPGRDEESSAPPTQACGAGGLHFEKVSDYWVCESAQIDVKVGPSVCAVLEEKLINKIY